MRRVFVPLAIITLVGACAHPPAQRGNGGLPGLTADTCSYDQCSMRVEEGGVLQGIAGRPVGKLSIFSGVGSVPWLNDSARVFAKSAQSSHVGATLVKALGYASYFGGVAFAVKASKDAVDRTNAGTGADTSIKKQDLYIILGLEIGGSVLGIIGQTIDSHARKMLSRAVWWHNRDLAR